MAESFIHIWSKKKATVSALSVNVVDSVSTDNHDRFEYVVRIASTIDNKIKSFKASVTRYDTALSDSVYAIDGDPLSVGFNANLVGSDCEIQIENNEPFAVDVVMARLKL